MLTHAEAQALVSARLDGPLDPIAVRELDAHLATCPSCRAFNTSSTQLMRGLRSMPYLPASPAVKRAVIDHIKTPRTPWNVVSGPWLTRAVPVVTAVAAALLLTVLGAFAFQRLNDTESPLDAVTSFLSQPAAETEPPDSNVTFRSTEDASNGLPAPEAAATEVPEAAPPIESDVVVPSATSQATNAGTEGQSGQGNAVAEPTATEVPEPTATDVPEPTATTAPEPTATDVPEPTATDVPEPTATTAPEPTATDVPEPTATTPPEPTATDVPEPTATTAPEPTATEVPEPTATDVPEPTATDVPEPTATEVPEPTATEIPEPTATTPPEPTATTPPTEASNEQIILPVDGTAVDADDGDATEEATQEDQPASVDPTSEPPRVDDITPTATDEDEGVIDPIDGQTPVDDADDEETPAAETPEPSIEAGTETPPDDGDGGDEGEDDGDGGGDQTPPDDGSGDDEGEGVIEPVDGGEATQETDGDTSGGSDEPDPGTEAPGDSGDEDDRGEDEGGPGVIVPSGGVEAPPDAAEGTPSDDGEPDVDNSGSGDGDDEGSDDGASGEDDGVGGNGGEGGDGDTEPGLGSAQEVGSVSNIPGDPGTRLGVGANNSIEFSVNPGRVSLTNNGLALDSGEGETGQAVLVCDEAGDCADVTSASAEGPHTDTRLGWIGSDIIYERIDANGNVTFRAVQFDSGTGEVIDDRELGGGAETLVRPYPVEGGLLVPTSDAWLLITADGVREVDRNPYGDGMGLYRFKPSSNAIAYVAGGEIVVTSLDSPGSPVAQVAFEGTDFDLSPDGSQIVVTDGSRIQILDLGGNVVREFSNDEGIGIGGITWTDGRGIVFVDTTNGVIRSIEP